MSASPTVAASLASDSRGPPETADACQREESRQRDSDCDSECSEVLSVGNEPPPAVADLEPETDDSRYLERNSISRGDDNVPRPASRTPSPASSASYGDAPTVSSPGGASSVRSPASSSAAASSPGRAEYGQDAALPRYSSQLLGRYASTRDPDPGELQQRLGSAPGLGHETAYPGAERLHRTPISVPVATRLSLSPPSAMTVSGLQVGTPVLHPTACRESRDVVGLGPLQHVLMGRLQPAAQLHAPATLVQQHKLSVNKILQRESPEDERLRLQQHLHNGSGRSNGVDAGNNDNNNTQHQASLKFSIDNILKADFGRRITDPISLKKSRTKKVPARPIDLSKDFVESSSEGSERGSERGSETSTRNVSPSLPASSPAPSATPNSTGESKLMQWPAWVYCTRYSDRPSSGPRTRRPKRPLDKPAATTPEEKRPRTAFSPEQLHRLTKEFALNKYLNEQRRQTLSQELGLNEAQIKIWFQNKRAKMKKASGHKNPLALQLMAQGLYNHSTVQLSKEEMEQAAELQAK